jgi:hypothetical protein
MNTCARVIHQILDGYFKVSLPIGLALTLWRVFLRLFRP